MGGGGMGWDGTEWDGTEWDGMGWAGMGWDGMGREWDGMGWDGNGMRMGRDADGMQLGLEWDSTGSGWGWRLGWRQMGLGFWPSHRSASLRRSSSLSARKAQWRAERCAAAVSRNPRRKASSAWRSSNASTYTYIVMERRNAS